MELFYRRTGSGPPLIILHGLYGSSDNWISIAKKLESQFDIIIPDQRNHGMSMHSSDFNYDFMQQDIYELMKKLSLNKATIIGHSMGGKTAMFFAKNYPEMISNLVIIDISPLSYINDETHIHQISFHKNLISALLKLNLNDIKNRNDADSILGKSLNQEHIRKFLLKNLKRNEQNKFIWQLNLKAINNSLYKLLDGIDPNDIDIPITGFPVVFIKGELSTYLKEKDKNKILSIFPSAEFKTINMTGHWLHAEQPEQLIKIIKSLFNND